MLCHCIKTLGQCKLISHQSFAFWWMSFHSGTNEVFEIDLTCNKKLLTHTGKHLLASRAKLCLGHFQSELFALGGADQSELDLCFRGNFHSLTSIHISESNLRNRGGATGIWFNDCVIHGWHYTVYKEFVNSPFFWIAIGYVFSVMRPKTKIELLKELREIVSNTLTESHVTRFGSISEKRQNRRLKWLRKELNEWIETMEKPNDIPVNTVQ